jgi:hypothetical protein
MKNFLFVLIVLILYNGLFAQTPPFKIYCNNRLVINDTAESYFRPVEVLFEFENKDTLYEIKKATLTFEKDFGSALETFPFHSNIYRGRSKVAFAKRIIVDINEIRVSYGGKVIKTIKDKIQKEIFLHSNYKMTDNEARYLSNGVKLLIRNKPAPLHYYYNVNDTLWKVSLMDTLNEARIKKVDLLAVRGKRPVCSNNASGDTINPTDCFKCVKQGDFIILKVYVNSSRDEYYMKVLIVD